MWEKVEGGCHLMGRQLWLAAEYEVVERANSPTRDQRRGVVSGMVTIVGLTDCQGPLSTLHM